MELNRDFSEFIASCIAHDVRFMIVGGYAVAAHGHPRMTNKPPTDRTCDRRRDGAPYDWV